MPKFLATYLASILLTTPAWANTYDFYATSGVDFGGHPIAVLNVPQDIVNSGSLSFTVECFVPAAAQLGCPDPWPNGLTGSWNFGGVIPAATSGFASYPVSLAFNSDGTMSGTFDVIEEQTGFIVRGSEYAWSGTIGNDLTGPLAVTGYWIDGPNPSPVPEPSSLALILPAIVALVSLSRRSGRPPTAGCC